MHGTWRFQFLYTLNKLAAFGGKYRYSKGDRMPAKSDGLSRSIRVICDGDLCDKAGRTRDSLKNDLLDWPAKSGNHPYPWSNLVDIILIMTRFGGVSQTNKFFSSRFTATHLLELFRSLQNVWHCMAKAWHLGRLNLEIAFKWLVSTDPFHHLCRHATILLCPNPPKQFKYVNLNGAVNSVSCVFFWNQPSLGNQTHPILWDCVHLREWEGSMCIRGCFKDRVGRVPIGQISVDSGCSRRAFMFCLVCLKHLPLLNTWNIFDVSMFHYKSRRVIRSFWGLCPIPLVLRIHDVSNSFDQQQLILQRSSAPGQGYGLCPFLQQHATPWKKKTLKILSHRFHSFKLKDSKLHVSKTEFHCI